VAVRHEHPTWKRWHQVRRIDWTLTILVVQVIVFLLLATMTSLIIPGVVFNSAPWIGVQVFDVRPPDELEIREVYWMCFWVLGVLGPLTGTWLTMGFSHLRRWKVWAAWGGLMLVIQFTFALMFIVATSDGGPFPMRIGTADLAARTFIAAGMYFAPGAIVLALIMVTALLGIPVGKTLLWTGKYIRSTRWRLRRRSRKQTRTA
jgi:hypothetical protein